MISGFCHEADEIWALLGYYTAHSSNSLPIYWAKL